MNPDTVVQPDTPDRVRRSVGVGLGVVIGALVTALALAFVVGLADGPATVPRLTFENPTDYALDVEISGGLGRGWTSAGSVSQHGAAVVEEVIDQADVWVFRFNSQGETGGEVRLTRSELEAAGWRIIVPADVGRRLAEAGAPPTP